MINIYVSKNTNIKSKSVTINASNTKRFYSENHLIKGFWHIASNNPVKFPEGPGEVVAVNRDDIIKYIYIYFLLYFNIIT